MRNVEELSDTELVEVCKWLRVTPLHVYVNEGAVRKTIEEAREFQRYNARAFTELGTRGLSEEIQW